ncbi:putative T7SS-secreted protein [Amycolatopsis minnesotensis]|uniref:Putative T7SS secretion signal domain-containing protein n=1 Tax=Amycolatopsis minnesotensis TaxID=337894 RepID=A0ABN2Q4F2_9PSEU
MAAELGGTEDPKALVPGDPVAVVAVADVLGEHAKTFGKIGEDLGLVRIEGWSGKACHAFWEGFSAEKPKWTLARDTLDSGAAALRAHAETLGWAQTNAAEAIRLWKQGEEASRKAVADFKEHQGGGVDAPKDPMLSDPGDALRKQARELLERSRKQLTEVGNATAAALGLPVRSPTWLQRAGQFAKEHKVGQLSVGKDKEFGDKAGVPKENMNKWGHQDPEEPKSTKPDVEVTILSGEAKKGGEWNLVDHQQNIGDTTFAASVDAEAGGKISGTLSAGTDGVKVAGAVSLGVTVTGEATWSSGPVEVGANGKAFVGGEAKGSVTIDKSGAHVGGSAFAGAKVEGEVKGDVAGVGAGLKGEAWAGAGAAANFDAGMKDGKFTLGGDLGVGLGVGGKVGFEFTVDPAKVVDSAGDVADKVGDTAGDAVNEAKKIAHKFNPFD